MRARKLLRPAALFAVVLLVYVASPLLHRRSSRAASDAPPPPRPPSTPQKLSRHDNEVLLALKVREIESTMNENELVARSDSDELDPSFVFDPSDMSDEHGDPYTIVLWSRRVGEPGYKANPKVCAANINCELSYNDKRLATAHAVVFSSAREIDTGLLSGVR